VDAPLRPEAPEVLRGIYRLFRDYFDLAEKKRRWALKDDIPWGQCNRSLNPAIGDVVETFCAVEMYLPDYLAKTLPQVRANRGRAWTMAVWGYEESKHSLALEDWLLCSGQRSESQMSDLEGEVFAHEWGLPQDNARAMCCYTLFQELATKVHYQRLREALHREGGCPALDRALALITVDEAAHADLFRRLVAIYLEHDSAGTLEQLRRVVNTFQMPAVHMLAGSQKRVSDIKKLGIFDEGIFVEHVYQPALSRLGLTPRDLRRKAAREVCVPLAGPNVKP
jgi:acyl-[acyl-carrier-protein] desaturase